MALFYHHSWVLQMRVMPAGPAPQQDLGHLPIARSRPRPRDGLVGFRPTPLKNDGVSSSVGMMKFPMYIYIYIYDNKYIYIYIIWRKQMME